MRNRNHPFAENSVMDIVVKLAHASFFDSLPSNVRRHPARAPTTMPAQLVAAPAVHRRWLEALEFWLHKQQMKEREAYLGRSQDVFELENRIRALERRTHF